MKRAVLGAIYLSVVTGCLAVSRHAEAQTNYVAFEPARYAFVDGDEEKFRALHWIKDDYAGGVREFRLEKTDEDEINTLNLSGHALIDENDLGGEMSLVNEDLGFFNMEYREFSRFYDSSGGLYYPFADFSQIELGRNLELEIGRLFLEAGLRVEDFPAVTFFYEHRVKDGYKSRLTWAAVREASSGTIRNIAPSYQLIDENVDIFGFRIEQEIGDFTMRNEEQWERMRTDAERYERQLSTTTTAADKKQRTHTQELRTDVFSSETEFNQWAEDDSWFWGVLYRYLRVDADEVEDIVEADQFGTTTNFGGSPKQVRNATAHNRYDSHTWVGNAMITPADHVSVITRLKTELIHRDGFSTYPFDSTPASPDGIINHTEVSDVNNRLTRFGESVSVRYTGIPRMALYGELELEQTRNWLDEVRNSLGGQSNPSANDIYARETIAQISNMNITLGTQYSPWQGANGTFQFRRGHNENLYEDVHETDPGSSTAKSSFVNFLNTTTNDLSARLTMNPMKRVRTSARYHLLTKDYKTQVEDEGDVRTDMDSAVYSFDVTVQPIDQAFVTGSVSWEDGNVKIPARTSPTAVTPKFDFDVTTWLLNAYYVVNENVTLTGSYVHSQAANFVDFTLVGLPLGSDYESTELSFSMDWKVKDGIHFGPQYSYLTYDSDSQVSLDSFDAHVIWLTFTADLA